MPVVYAAVFVTVFLAAWFALETFGRWRCRRRASFSFDKWMNQQRDKQ